MLAIKGGTRIGYRAKAFNIELLNEEPE